MTSTSEALQSICSVPGKIAPPDPGPVSGRGGRVVRVLAREY